MKQLLKLKAMGLLFLLLSIGYVKAQSLTPAEPVRSEQVPTWDAAGYDAQKAQWVAENPALYDQMVNNPGKEAVQAPVSNTPWGAPENKAAWVAAHPQEYAVMTQQAPDNRTRMTRAQFDAYPKDKQQAIVNDPNFIIID